MNVKSEMIKEYGRGKFLNRFYFESESVPYHDSPGSGLELASVGAARMPDIGGSFFKFVIRSSCIL